MNLLVHSLKLNLSEFFFFNGTRWFQMTLVDFRWHLFDKTQIFEEEDTAEHNMWKQLLNF